jgi:hypothetical protein
MEMLYLPHLGCFFLDREFAPDKGRRDVSACFSEEHRLPMESMIYAPVWVPGGSFPAPDNHSLVLFPFRFLADFPCLATSGCKATLTRN